MVINKNIRLASLLVVLAVSITRLSGWAMAVSPSLREPEETGADSGDVQKQDLAEMAQELGFLHGKQISASHPKEAEKIALVYLDTFSKGIREGLLDKSEPEHRSGSQKPKLSLKELLVHFRRNPFDSSSNPYAAESEKFLAENLKKVGVQVMPSGLQYEVVQMGGGQLPTAQDVLLLTYRGTLLDGTVFEESPRGEPTLIPLDALVPGCAQAVLSMTVGSKWNIWMPARLGYGETGKAPHVNPGQMLRYELELAETLKPDSLR